MRCFSELVDARIDLCVRRFRSPKNIVLTTFLSLKSGELWGFHGIIYMEFMVLFGICAKPDHP